MCYNIHNPRYISIAQLHTMANVDMLCKRRMLQLLCIIYEIATKPKQDRVVVHHTGLANKNNIELKFANMQLYSKSPYSVGGNFGMTYRKKYKI